MIRGITSMDKYDFIKQLEAELAGLSEEERNSAVSYYKELFEDAGNDKVQELIENLGSPQEIAENIKRESGAVTVSEKPDGSSNTEKVNIKDKEPQPHIEKRRDGGTILLLTIILILTSPVWLSLVAAFYAVVFALLCVIIVLALVFGIIGIAGIVSGFSTIFAVPPVGMVLLGLGLVFTAITLMCAPFLCKGAFGVCRAIINGTVSVFHSIFYRRETAV